MIRVLFVCTGNVCRSPMAEAVFAHLVKQAGLEGKIEADSAGTIDYHEGERAHPGTLRILRRHGIPYDGRARPLDGSDFDEFDYLIAMDDSHLRTLQRYMPGNAADGPVVARLLDYAPNAPHRDVPDPYYNGQFDLVYDLVLEGARGLLAKIREDHDL